MKFYVTTAIAYVNDRPGLHHGYEFAGADALARFHRQRGDEVFFLTGTDENATRNEQAAKEQGIATRQLVDKYAAEFRQMADLWNISYDRFIRTVDPDHVAGVQEFVRRWIANDDVYLSKYEGLYCSRCEAFYEESELVDEHGSRDGPHVRCPIHTSNPDAIQRLNEENYFFRLSKYEQKLKDLYRDNPDFCVPEIRRNEVLGWLDRGLRDVSVSRRNLTWGIPFPDKPGHTVYVWFDALINYVTGIGFGTDEKKFKLPRQVYAHGFLEYAGQGRLSRSSGNMIDPIAAANEWGSDALRYLLLREAPFAKDSPISPEILDLRFNADLANGLGNLVSRATKMVELYRDGRVPSPGKGGPSEKALRETAERALATHDESAAKLDFADALAAIFSVVEEANRHFQRTQPWQAVKDTARRGEVDASLYAGLEAVRIVAYLLYPYMPTISPRIADVLDVESPATAEWEAVARWGLLRPGEQIHSAPSLFPRLERAKTA
ncbi:MAG: methionine--tRNA ligase [Chloroflexi bacterium]|nr:MAG: methionine--tRNA ligase [Chloroflexota bacterium]